MQWSISPRHRELAYLRKPLKYSYTLTLSVVLVLSLLSAVWAGFYAARKLVAPIRNIAEGTRALVLDCKVGSGAFLSTRGEPGLAAVAGNVKVGNRSGPLTILQSIEYVTGLNLGRRAQHVLGCITTVPGAAAAWRRTAIEAVGGVPDATRIEDTDLTIRVQRAGWRVVYEPRAVALTEAPNTLRGLVAQRTRWIAGYLQVVWLHKDGLFRYGALGWLGLPDLIYRNVLAFVLLPLIIPAISRVVTAFSWAALAELVFGLLAFDLVATALAYVEDRERAREILWAPVRRIVWPWFLAAVLVRVLIIEVRRGEVPWAKVRRQGALARASQEPEGPRIIR